MLFRSTFRPPPHEPDPILPVTQTIISKLFRGTNPYDGFPLDRKQKDLQGWNSQHPYLTSSVRTLRPNLIVEIGVWKGGSCTTMARELKSLGIDGCIIAVDTWLGSSEHWIQPQFFPELALRIGRPTLYEIFLNNILAEGLDGHVLPLPLDSSNAANVLSSLGLKPELIHIDASHDFESTMADLARWWRILLPGGHLIVDDYDQSGRIWPSVKRAVDEFRSKLDRHDFEAIPNKCRIHKPVSRAPAPPATS